ncbi:Xaa-Pro dipeptidase [Zostera marina]|uniref:Xaa-Pro dipeptidase n=1 Tax=Zostera marina TaxID=29655 RepID=A0A0K9PY16_ZOSMR|nr:Xaa-Pro dipeptidase [Zostera marina]
MPTPLLFKPSTSPSRLSPPMIPMELHALNRDKLVRSIREHLVSDSLPVTGFVVLQGGEQKTRYCTDHEELFRQESYFAYLFGVKEPDFFGAIDLVSGKSILFAPRLPSSYAVWMGEIKQLTYFKEMYKVDMVFYSDEISEILHKYSGGLEKPLLFLLYGLNTDSGNYSKPADFKDMEKFDKDLTTLHPILTECRVLKSQLELQLIQFANDISSEAHIQVMRKAGECIKEYQLESLFLNHIYMYGGCRHCSYTCIAATGENASILHYGHAAAPNDRTLRDGDMALLDMGGEFHFYGSDITCSFPINGKFTSDQCLIYNAVLKSHDAVISKMQPGVNWVDMHKLAERTILESLKTGGILLGNVDEMMVKRLGAIFMPHGLGHLLGLDTHDPGGYPEGVERPKERGLKSLRTARKLEEGMVITVEPGCYFIDPLLIPAMEDSETSKFFHEKINGFKNFGGIRIESNLYVTNDGCQNLSNCPRETWEIEAVMAGAPWPIEKKSE